MLFFNQSHILPFLCHKSATTCQIDSYKVSNSKLKPDLSSCVKTEMIESTVPPQQPHERGTIFWDTLYNERSTSSFLVIQYIPHNVDQKVHQLQINHCFDDKISSLQRPERNSSYFDTTMRNRSGFSSGKYVFRRMMLK